MIIQGKIVDEIIVGNDDCAISLGNYNTTLYGDIKIKFVRYHEDETEMWTLDEFEELPWQTEDIRDRVLASMVKERGKVAVIKQICNMNVGSERK